MDLLFSGFIVSFTVSKFFSFTKSYLSIVDLHAVGVGKSRTLLIIYCHRMSDHLAGHLWGL